MLDQRASLYVLLVGVILAVAGCSKIDDATLSRAPSQAHYSQPQLPRGAHLTRKGRYVDEFNRLLVLDAGERRWLSASAGHLVATEITPSDDTTPKIIPVINGRSLIQDCTQQPASSLKHTMDCCTDTTCGGAIFSPPPPQVSSLQQNPDGSWSDQNGNTWDYCAACLSDNGSKGEWDQEIGSVSSSPPIGVPGDGFEVLDLGPFPNVGTEPDTSYQAYPVVNYIYYNVNHFWAQHLACYLKSSQDQFMDAVAADLNSRIGGGFSGPYGQFTFVFQDAGGAQTIEYRVYRDPVSRDWIVGTAFIPGKPNC